MQDSVAQDIEVELKFKVDDRSKLEKWLKEKAKFKYEHHQVDHYYTPAHRNFMDLKHPVEYLRIRHSGKQWSAAYKYWHKTESGEEYSHCEEYETNVDDGKQLKKIFKVLDFKLLLTIDKKRKAYQYENFEIDVDEVKDLGSFCEIENKGKFSSIDEARSEVKKLAEHLGLDMKNRNQDGYVYMMAKKRGLL